MTAGNHPATSRQASPAAYLRRLRRLPPQFPTCRLPGSGFGTQSARPADGGQGAVAAAEAKRAEPKTSSRKSENYYDIKSTIFNALIDAIDLTQLGQLDRDAARDEIRDIVNEIITLKDVVMSIAEQEELLEDICNDVLGYGPLEPLLARDDIADIMVNGANTTFIEVAGKMQKTGVRFRDNAQLLNICQRIVSQIGRRVDEASPICDARLLDGSRVNVIVPPWRSMDPRSPSASSRRTGSSFRTWCASAPSRRKAPPFSRSSAGCAATC